MKLPAEHTRERLQQEILRLQGSKATPVHGTDESGLGLLAGAFPNGVFPRAAVHEFLCSGIEEGAATTAFVSGILSSLLRGQGAVLWVSAKRRLFPPALAAFGIRPEQVLFLDVRRHADVAWAVAEALACRALTAVVGELPTVDLTLSRRYQLAIESSGVACFLLRQQKAETNTAAVTRWQVTHSPSRLDEDLPGVGLPRWQVDLLKVRNGRPGSWQLEWAGGRFRLASPPALVHPLRHTKTG